MRTTPLHMAMAWALATGLSARADSDAVVILPEVDVRSGPSINYYPTGKLRKNDRVRVLEDKDGWLAIKPPPGSFNWIEGRFLDPQRRGPTSPVQQDDVKIMIGSAVYNGKPTVCSKFPLPKAAQVVILGDPITDAEATWWPIQAPPTEVRYISAEAIKDTKTVQQPPGPSSLAMSPLAPSSAANSSGPASQDSLWLKAEEAEREGRLADAQALYGKLAQETKDNDLRVHCYNRLQFLQERLRAAAPVTVNYPPRGGDPRIPAAADGFRQPAQPTNALVQQSPSIYTFTPVPTPPAALAVQPSAAGPGPAPPAPAQPSSVTLPGYLRRSTVPYGNGELYSLEDSQGRQLAYVTSSTLDLKPYLNRYVQLQGILVHDPMLTTNLMTVTGATPLR
jgi:hypothetical protein